MSKNIKYIRESITERVGGNQYFMCVWCSAHLMLIWSEEVVPPNTMIEYHKRVKMSIFFSVGAKAFNCHGTSLGRLGRAQRNTLCVNLRISHRAICLNHGFTQIMGLKYKVLFTETKYICIQSIPLAFQKTRVI